MTEHTPTPWQLNLNWDGHVYDVAGPGDVPICMVAHDDVRHDVRLANAAFIVKAVNAHDALVKARETFLGYLQAENGCSRKGTACREKCACELELRELVKAFRVPVGGAKEKGKHNDI